MRAPFLNFGSIGPRVFLPVLLFTLTTAFTGAFAQAPAPGLGGGFEVDGNLFANNPGGIIGLGDDWLDGAAGPGAGVLNPDGTVKNAVTTVHILDRTGNADLDVFDGSNKVLQNPNTYKWKAGSVPQKDDIQHGLVHMSTDGSGNHWMRIAGDRRSINGDSYIDYEFLQATLVQKADGSFSSAGPDSGRTVGDILLTIHLSQGGSQAEFFAQRWEAVGDGFTYVSIPFPGGQAFVAANIDSTIVTPFGAFGSNVYGVNQFGEAAINLDALLPNFSNCFGVATVFVRTKSSTSPEAVLKDFIEPVQVSLCLDDVPPVLTVPGDLSLACNQSTAPGSAGLATATDNCDEDVQVSYVDTILPGGCATNYTIQREWTATDGCGNIDQAVQLIAVADNTAPVIVSSPGPLSLQCRDDVPAPNPDLVVTTDECGRATVVHVSDVSNGRSCPEVITRTYRVSDACGNGSDVIQLITIDDNTPPSVAALAAVNVQCRGDVPAANTGIVQASDNCGTPVVTHLSDVSNGQSCPEVITRTYRVTDACGNVTDRVQTITIDDTTRPTIEGPAAVLVSCVDDVPGANLQLISAGDNCGEPVVTHVSDTSDGKQCPQVITRRYRATDACGNTNDWVQLITIDDDNPPSALPLPDVIVSCSNQVPAPNPGLVQATDNCGGVFVGHRGDVSDGKACGTTIRRTYRVADACGNFVDVVQKIIVDDRTAPVITASPGPLTVSCEGDIPLADPSLVRATDNCGAVSIVHAGDASDGKTCPTVITRTYRATDSCGNATLVLQTITVDDDVPPVLSACGPDRTLECPGSVVFDRPGATDNCDDSPSVRIVNSDSTLGPEGWTYRVTRTFQAFDDCGNASQQCSQTLTVHCEVDALCSFTQGAYGSYGGYFNGMSTIQLIRSLLDDAPLVVGKPGRSLKFNLNAADCIVLRLPSGGTATTLPAIGNATMNHNSCQTPIPVPLDSNGKFRNVLLGQTITLSLNSRLSPWMPLFPLTERFCTQKALPGKDGLMGTPDDVRDTNAPVETYTISPAVLRALDNLGLPRLVAGLLELCNRALAAQATGGASLSQINDAASTINEAFDGCRFITECGDVIVVVPGSGEYRPFSGPVANSTVTIAPTRFELGQNAPNPFNPVTTIRLALPEAARWTVAVFDIAGRLVNRFDGETSGAAYVDVRWDGTDRNGAPVASGVYLYQVQAGPYRDVKKMVLLK